MALQGLALPSTVATTATTPPHRSLPNMRSQVVCSLLATFLAATDGAPTAAGDAAAVPDDMIDSSLAFLTSVLTSGGGTTAS